MPDEVVELLLTEAALDKLGARTVSADEVGQLLRNAHALVRNPRGPTPESRRLLIGRTNGGRCLTLLGGFIRSSQHDSVFVFGDWRLDGSRGVSLVASG